MENFEILVQYLNNMGRIIFVTNNKHKVEEVNALVQDQEFTFVTPHDLGRELEVEEDQPSFEGNAEKKARAGHQVFKMACLAEDSGLVVPVLNGAPGIYSARYAGTPQDPARNMAKLLDELQNVEDRSAYFISVFVYLDAEGQVHIFEGRCPGRIAKEVRGTEGFGYDPIFIPDGYDRTFAELGNAVKHSCSHRQKSLHKFLNFLRSQNAS